MNEGPLRRVLAEPGTPYGRLALAGLLGLASAAATIGLLAGSGYVLGRAALRPGLGAIAGILATVEVLAFLRGPLRYAERLVGHDAALRALTRWRVWLYDCLTPRVPAALAGWRSGDLLARAVDDVDNLQDLYLRTLLPIAIAVGAGIVGVVAVGVIVPWAAVALGVPLAMALTVPSWLTWRRSGDDEMAALAGTLAARAQVAPSDPGDTSPASDLRGYLQTVDHGRLVDLILELSGNDELLRARLQLDAARAGTRPASLQHLKNAIDDVVVPADVMSWRESSAYATNIRTMLDTLRTMLHDGHAEAVIDLAEHALARLEDAAGHVDDFDGHLGDIAGALQALHLRACRAARPNPVALATRLFERERDAGDLDVFAGAASTYAPALGKRGLAEYRRLAEAEWDRLPPLRRGDERGDSGMRFRIARMMESLAEATGDVDAVVAVLAKDQSSSWRFVRIAERLRQAGRHADALAWAERGLGTFGEDADPRLVEVLTDEYHRAGRSADAVALAWRILDGRPSPDGYRRIAAQAQRAGVWEAWRQRALDRLRADVRRRMRTDRGASVSPWAARAGASDTVDVLLWEGEVEQAWTEATALGCSDRLWCELAHQREGDHPLDAIPVWQAEVERLIEARSNDGYRQAVELMAHVAELMRAAGQPEAFRPYASGVRTRHRAKRNLVKLLDTRHW